MFSSSRRSLVLNTSYNLRLKEETGKNASDRLCYLLYERRSNGANGSDGGSGI